MKFLFESNLPETFPNHNWETKEEIIPGIPFKKRCYKCGLNIIFISGNQWEICLADHKIHDNSRWGISCEEFIMHEALK